MKHYARGRRFLKYAFIQFALLALLSEFLWARDSKKKPAASSPAPSATASPAASVAPAASADGQAAPGESTSLVRSNKMEFDERLVKGQAAKSGAVYLFKRVPRTLPELVAMRRSYRRRITEPLLGERALSKTAKKSASRAKPKAAK